MAHEILSEKVDLKDILFVKDYCERNFSRQGVEVPGWIAIKTIGFLRKNYEFELIRRIHPNINLVFPSELERPALTIGFDQEIKKTTALDTAISNFEKDFEMYRKSSRRVIYNQIFAAIERAKKECNGFSFVRLGDGEGNAIAMHRRHGDVGIESWGKAIFDLQFGADRLISSEQQAEIGALIERAAINADVVGIASPEYLIRKIKDRDWPADRQLHGNLECYELLSAAENSIPSDVMLTDSSIHKDMSFIDSVLEIFRGDRVVTFVGPHGAVLDAKTDLSFKATVMIKVPGEHKYFKPKVHHYLESYDVVCDQLRPAYKGAPFFIGAGLLGKHYCNLVKTRGGIAIDIGSAMDDLVGLHHTRSGGTTKAQ